VDKTDRIITFESYYDPLLAQIVRTKLKANGILCFIADDNMLGAKPYYNQLLGGIKIKVFEKDTEKCHKILATPSEAEMQGMFKIDNELNAGPVCPYCASTNVRHGVATKFAPHWPSILLSIFFLVPIYFRNAWHCFNCQGEFR
jgi:hypothetical protein